MQKLLRTARIALSLAALAAASSGAAARTAPVAVKTVNPADGAARVDLMAPVRLTFDGALDPSSVTRAHVVLTHHGMPVASTVSYDAGTHRITVQPIDLATGDTVTVSATGLVDSFGRAVVPFTSTFATWLDPQRTEKTIYTSDGHSIAFRTTTTFDADGHRTRTVTTDGPGADGRWGTADDSIGSYTSYAVRADGLEGNSTDYAGPGPDGVWFTADDVVASTTTRTYSPAGAPQSWTVHYTDAPTSACCDVSMTFHYDATGLQTGLTLRYPGPDGAMGTADDAFLDEAIEHDALGRYTGYEDSTAGAGLGFAVRTWRDATHVARTDYYWTDGPDGLPASGDDLPALVIANTFDAQGRLWRATSYHDAGPDGVWHTADDVPSSYVRYWRDDHGNLLRALTFDGPGPDGVWFTADDHVQTTQTYDASR